MDSSIRYQIRLGSHDFRIFLKFYKESQFDPYREIPSELIDTNETCAKIKTNNTEVLPEEEDFKEQRITDWRAREMYKEKKEFQQKMKNRKKNVTLLQINEFLHSCINGTKSNQYRAFFRHKPRGGSGQKGPIHGVISMFIYNSTIKPKCYVSFFNTQKFANNNDWTNCLVDSHNKSMHIKNGNYVTNDLKVIQFNTGNGKWVNNHFLLLMQIT